MEILKKLRVSRRFALQGAVGGIGVSLWLPILDAMCDDHGEAFAQGDALPTSFGIFFWGNGFNPDQFNPSGSGASWQLPPTMEPFGELKNDMTFVTGLDMMDGQFKGHGWGVMYVLAGGDGNIISRTSEITRGAENANATQYKPTIDQIIADAIHTDQPFKSIETGVLAFKGINMGTVSNNLAHRGPNDFLPPERDPAKLFNTLFGNGVPSGTGGSSGVPMDVSNTLRRSVLDAVWEDANRLKMTVGAADAMRIDAHMESIRAVELRIPEGSDGGTTPPMGCNPTEPATNLPDVTAKSQALNRLITAAVACNMTRVYTHLWSGARDENTYPQINVNRDHHTLTHDGNTAEHTKIERYIMEQYADLATVMKETTIGATNVLDQTLIYGISDIAFEPQWHVHTDYRIVLMGHAGGQLPGNRHVRLQGRKVTELMLTMQQVMGLQVNSYGSWDQTSTTMPEILA
jgi:hypothetical protein